jgi:hypothetical protein
MTINNISNVVGGSLFLVDSGNTPTIAPTAYGCIDSIALGSGAIVNANDSITLGQGFNAGTYSLAGMIGNSTNAYGNLANYSLCIGSLAYNGGDYNVVLGGYLNKADLESSYAVIIGGYNNYSPSDRTICLGGQYLSATNEYAIALGGFETEASNYCAVGLGGYQNSSGGRFALAAGTQANAYGNGQFAYANGFFEAQGDAQISQWQCKVATANATPTNLLFEDSTFFVLNNDTTYHLFILVTARDSSGNSAGWTFNFGIKKASTAASTVFIGSPTKTLNFADTSASSWDANVIADTINGALQIQATGASSTNIRWHAFIKMNEIIY